jgi:hypothetical protein
MSSESVDLTGVVVLRRELLADGHNDAAIRRLLTTGDLHRVRHGAYIDGGLWRSLDDADRHRVLVRAVMRTAHPSAVVSHSSSAVEHGADTYDIDLGVVHITRRDGRIGRREAGVVQHRGRLQASDVEMVNGLPVTTPARCAVEVISLTSAESALVTVDSLLHAGKVDREHLITINRALKHWPSTLTAAVVLRLSDERIESVGESRMSYLFHSQGLPRPTPQVVIRDELGREVGRTDFALPEAGVFFEFQGREKYFRYRREGESLDDYLMREKRRIELICQLTGWICIPITWADLEHPRRTAARIRRILATRQHPVA